MKRKKYFNILIWAVYIMSVFALSYTFAIERASLSDYVSINGDFQSYNVFRRILDGQTPYKDFSNYIGMAPVWTNILFVSISNSFTNSLFVTTFTSCVIFCIAVVFLFWLVSGNIPVSMAVSVLLPKVTSAMVFHRLFGPRYGYFTTERLKGLYTPSNSMRGARSFLPFLLSIAILIFIYICKKVFDRKIEILDYLSNFKVLFFAGLILGLFIPWSNDYGIGAVAAFLFILIITQIFYYKLPVLKFVKNIIIFTIGCILGLLVIATLITDFHPSAYFSSVLQTADYQFFYFNGTAGKPVVTYLFSTPAVWIFTSVFIAFWFFALYRLVNNKADNNLVLLVFISLTIVAATFIYILGGSGHNCREALEVYSVLFLLAVIVKVITEKIKILLPVSKISAFLLITILSAYFTYQSISFTPEVKGQFIEELGGYSTLTKELVDAKNIVGDEKVFSTYATGLELATNQFQPTGYDYIIHALGKETQEKYTDNFINNNYRFVHTTSLPVESWVAMQNWHFYRLFLPEYKQIYKTEYGWLWEKSDIPEINADINVTIERISNQSVEIVCTSDNTDEFVADICISYDTKFTNLKSRFLSANRKTVLLNGSCLSGDIKSGSYLPASSTEYIPVKMIDGYGKTTLTACFGSGIDLNVHSAEFIGTTPALDFNKEL